ATGGSGGATGGSGGATGGGGGATGGAGGATGGSGGATGGTGGCTSDGQCTTTSAPKCKLSTHQCVQCLGDGDCPSTKPKCEDNNTCG
ncbi:MAG: hypothetical protein DYH12_34840, partial [Sorangiineae bacterium PRO1]|nr:hypothetical protein [Sorangiineae bacterium PRO1]